MKSLKTTIVILIAIIISSCSITKKVEKSILGKWAITNVYDESKKDNPEYKNLVKDLLKDSYIEFKEDKTFEISIMGKKQSDSWKISEDGKKILTDNKNIYFEVLEINESVIKLRSSKNNNSVLLDLHKI